MIGDFPDRDEWTDRPLITGNVGEPTEEEMDELVHDTIESLAKTMAENWIASARKQQADFEKQRRNEFDEASEWESLGDTDLISTEELADVVRPEEKPC